MRHSLPVPIAPGRKLGAWVCLVAALLLWSPLLAAAWQSVEMSCCIAGMCPAHGHTSDQRRQPASSQQHPMTCDHQAGSNLLECSMSCCHTEPRSFVASIVFVVPSTVALSRLPDHATPLLLSSERAPLPPVIPPDLPPRLIPS
jgi:hypothetical protein